MAYTLTKPDIDAVRASSNPAFQGAWTKKALDLLDKDSTALIGRPIEERQDLVDAIKVALPDLSIDGATGTQEERTKLINHLADVVKARKTTDEKTTDEKTTGEKTTGAKTTGANTALPSSAMFGATLNAEYSAKWGFDMTASSRVTAKLVAIPPPQAFLDALEEARQGIAKKAQQGSSE